MLKLNELTERLNRANSNSKNPSVKLKALIDYLAENYSENSNEISDGVSLEEAIYVAKKNICEYVIHNRQERGIDEKSPDLLCNYGAYGDKGDWTMGFFMRSPRDAVQYLSVQAKQNAIKNGDNAKAEQYQNLAAAVNGRRYNYENYEAFRSERKNDMMHIDALYNGERAVDKAFKNNKAGFVEKWMGWTSSQYKEFEQAFSEYRNDKEDGANYETNVSRKTVQTKAANYLRYKLKGYDGKGLPKIEDINRLKGKAKNRAMFCYNVLKSTKESEVFEEKSTSLKHVIEDKMRQDGTNVVYDKLCKADSIDPATISAKLNDLSPVKKAAGMQGSPESEQLTDSQKNFQKSLAKDLEDKHVGVDVKKMYEENNIEIDADDLDMSVDQ